MPTTAAEWVGAGFQAPAHIWLFQEASGAILDKVGSKNLSAAGTVAYQQAVAGWTAKAIGSTTPGTTGNCSNATMENLNANSVLTLTYSQFTLSATTLVSRAFHGAASVNDLQANAASAIMRLRTGANAANGTGLHAATIHPIAVRWDRTNTVNAAYSDIEKVGITWADTAGTTMQVTAATLDTAFVGNVMYAATWVGASAELVDAQIKSMLQALGWTVTGY